jgi:hypothetical protein
MGFYELLDQVVDLLRRRGRVTYRALKREFQVDDAFLEELKAEIITAQRLAVDEQGAVLVWVGEAGTPPVPREDAPSPQAEPCGDERRHPEAERRQLTVPLFAALLSLSLTADYAPLTMSPERQKPRTLRALLIILLRIAAQQPVLFRVASAGGRDASAGAGPGWVGLAQLRQGSAGLGGPHGRTMLAEVFAHLGHVENSPQALAEARTLVEQHEERWWEAEIHRLRGVLLLQQPGTPPTSERPRPCWRNSRKWHTTQHYTKR